MQISSWNWRKMSISSVADRWNVMAMWQRCSPLQHPQTSSCVPPPVRFRDHCFKSWILSNRRVLQLSNASENSNERGRWTQSATIFTSLPPFSARKGSQRHLWTETATGCCFSSSQAEFAVKQAILAEFIRIIDGDAQRIVGYLADSLTPKRVANYRRGSVRY